MKAKKMSSFTLAVLLTVILACSWGHAQARETSGQSVQNNGSLLYSENFNSYENGTLPPGWWVEGGQSVYVEDGHLRINADPKRKKGPGYVATVWYKKKFSGNVRIQFDARVVSSTIKANNINFFLYFTHPGKDSTMYGTRNLRLDGLYSHYHNLNGYIFTFLRAKKNQARFRLRRCPGFEMIDENLAYHNRQGETYHITVTKRDKKLRFAVDGTVYLRVSDDKYNWTKGIIGFRTFQSDVWFDNLEVRRETNKQR
jgi:hypothetical protein